MPDGVVYVYFLYQGAKTVIVIMTQNEDAEQIDHERYKERTLGYINVFDVVGGTNHKLRNLKIPARTTLVSELRSY